jgi:hypothetical protein
MHAKYIALSSGMRELIPISNTLDHICSVFKITRDNQTKIIRVWEDNEGAQKLATALIQKVTPHSKHFGIKYHWFREKLAEYHISICRVHTDFQKADIFTKGLTRSEFQIKRKLLMGW